MMTAHSWRGKARNCHMGKAIQRGNMEDWTKARITITRQAGAVVVTIPARRNWFAVTFISFWLCAWTGGGLTAMGALVTADIDPGGRAFMTFWLGAWAVGWAMAFGTISWMLAGREVLTLEAGRLTRELIAVLRFRIWTYPTTAIRDLTVIATDGATFFNQGRRNVMGSAGLAFDFGARTVAIGLGLDRAEARVALEALSAGLPKPASA
jgi:hypothetical protein